MKFLLTSAGIKNASIHGALGRPAGQADCRGHCSLHSDRDLCLSRRCEADALLVGGGDPLYLCYWIQQSGLADLFPSRRQTVWVGVSAGRLVIGPHVGEEFVYGSPLTGGDRALGLVDFAIFPHLDHEAMPDHSMANAKRWAAGVPVPGYAIDDETAIKVVDDTVEVVSERHWKLFSSSP
jgi:dipeptidase E